MIKQKKTKKKNVNVNQTVVVNIQKGKRNPRAKASAPPIMSAPQIIPPQVGSAYHQAVYGARAPAIPSMGNVPGYYAGMISPFNAPLHIASEVQQAQLKQMNELAGQNVARPGVSQQSATAPIYNLDKQEAKPMTVPLSLTPAKPFQPSLPMEAPEVAATAASSSSSSSSSSRSSLLSPEEATLPPVEMNDRVLGIRISQQSLNELPYKRKDRNDTRVFLTDIASARGIPLPRSIVGKKADVINYLIQQINKW